jgi:hypothetical protein
MPITRPLDFLNPDPATFTGKPTVQVYDTETVDTYIQIIEDRVDNIGTQVIYAVDFRQPVGNPVAMDVVTHYLDGVSPPTTVTTLFTRNGHLNITYDNVLKTVMFNNTAVGFHTYPAPAGITDLPEVGDEYIWTTVPATDLLLNDLIVFYDSTLRPVFFGYAAAITGSSVTVKVLSTAYRYGTVKTYLSKAAFPAIVDAETRFFYVAQDTGHIYAFINNEYKSLNDGGVLNFADVSMFPATGDDHFLYVDNLHGDIYSWLVNKYVLLNDGGVINVDAAHPRPAIGNPRFLYIDTDNGFVYAWIVNRYVMLNDGGVLFVDNYSDLPLTPNEKFLYGVRNTGNIYAWLKGVWILLNDGGIKTVSSSNPRPATGDPKFLYTDTDTGLIYAWITDRYVILNDGGVRLYAQRSDFPNPGDYRFLYIDQMANDIYAWLGTQYVLLNDGGIRKVATVGDLPVAPNDRFLFQVTSTNDIYAYLGSQWVLLNDGGVITVATYADLPGSPNSRFIYAVTADNKAYVWLNSAWVLLNREGGLYIGVYQSVASLPANEGDIGDFAIVKRDETTTDLTSAIYTITGIDGTGVRLWTLNASLRDIIGPKFLGYFYTESALISRISANPANVNINDFAFLLDNNQANPSVPVQHLPPNAANRVWLYIVKTVTPSITLDNQVYIDSKGAYKGTYATVADLPTNIMFNNAGAKKGDWVIVANNGSDRSALYVIDDYNVLAPSISWVSAFVFPQTDVYDALDGQGKSTVALSANQGYILDQKVQALESDIHVRGVVLNAFVPQGNFYSVETAIPDIGPYYAMDILSLVIATAGSGYVAGDVLTVETDDLKPTIHVDSVDGGGAIIGASVMTNGYSTTNMTTATITGGTGTGVILTFTMSATDKNGFGYMPGDALILSNSDSKIDGIIVIDTVDSRGGVLTSTTSKKGSFSVAPSSFTPEGGVGYGLMLSVTTGQEPNSTLYSIVLPKANDVGIVLEDEIHSNQAWQWIYADYNGDGVYNWVPLAPHNVTRDFYVDPIQEGEIAPGAITIGDIGFDLMLQYTFVVRTNQDLDDWCDAKPGNDYTSILVLGEPGTIITASPGKFVDTALCGTHLIDGMMSGDHGGGASPAKTFPVLLFTDSEFAIKDSVAGYITRIQSVRFQLMITTSASANLNHHVLAFAYGVSHMVNIRDVNIVLLTRNNATSTAFTSYTGIANLNRLTNNIQNVTMTYYNYADSATVTQANTAQFVAFQRCANISNCYVAAPDVAGVYTAGGIICFNECTDIQNCMCQLTMTNAVINGDNVATMECRASDRIRGCNFSYTIKTVRVISAPSNWAIFGAYDCSYIYNNRFAITVTATVGSVTNGSIRGCYEQTATNQCIAIANVVYINSTTGLVRMGFVNCVTLRSNMVTGISTNQAYVNSFWDNAAHAIPVNGDTTGNAGCNSLI